MITQGLSTFQITTLESIADGAPLLATIDGISQYVESQCENVRRAIAFVDAETSAFWQLCR